MINERAAAIDIGARVHVAAVDPERCAEPVQTFQAFTGDFSAWHGGSRKWALKQWLWSRPAFIGYPSTRYWKITAWRSCWPTRAKPVPYQAARVMSVMHSGCNVCLPVGDFTPVFAQAGRERNPQVLARMRDDRCKASEHTVQSARVGNDQPEHVCALKQALELYEFYQARIQECDAQIEQALASITAEKPEPMSPLPALRHRSRSAHPVNFEVRPLLYPLTGTHLTQIHGIGPHLALRLVSECGTDLSRWPSAKHFASW